MIILSYVATARRFEPDMKTSAVTAYLETLKWITFWVGITGILDSRPRHMPVQTLTVPSAAPVTNLTFFLYSATDIFYGCRPLALSCIMSWGLMMIMAVMLPFELWAL